jgi:hypothetical protein
MQDHNLHILWIDLTLSFFSENARTYTHKNIYSFKLSTPILDDWITLVKINYTIHMSRDFL